MSRRMRAFGIAVIAALVGCSSLGKNPQREWDYDRLRTRSAGKLAIAVNLSPDAAIRRVKEGADHCLTRRYRADVMGFAMGVYFVAPASATMSAQVQSTGAMAGRSVMVAAYNSFNFVEHFQVDAQPHEQGSTLTVLTAFKDDPGRYASMVGRWVASETIDCKLQP